MIGCIKQFDSLSQSEVYSVLVSRLGGVFVGVATPVTAPAMNDKRPVLGIATHFKPRSNQEHRCCHLQFIALVPLFGLD